MTSYRRLLLIPLVFAAIFLVYGRALDGGFVFDDHHFVEENPAIRTLANTFRFFSDPTTRSTVSGLNTDVYRPLTLLSYALDYAAAGPSPLYFRCVNVLLHCVNVLLLFVLGRLLGFQALYAALMAGFFALFPVNVESVAWIASRSTVLSTALMLAALIFFIRRAQEGRRADLLLCLAFTLAALFTRETAVMLPLLALSYVAAAGLPVKKHLRDIGLYLALPAVLFAALRFFLLGRFQQIPQHMPAADIAALPFLLFAKYLEVLVYPLDMLVTYTDLVLLRLHAYWFYVPFALLLCLLYAGLAAALYKRGQRLAAWGLFWILLTLLPVLNIAAMTFFMAERLTYLPVIGLAIALGAAAQKLRPKLKKYLFAGLAALAVLFTVNLQGRLAVWHDDVSLWRYDAAKNPWNFLTRMRLADALRSAKDYEGAIAELRVAVNLAADRQQQAVVYNETGLLLALTGNAKKAGQLFLRSAALYPASGQALYNLGKVSYLQGDMKGAAKYLAASLEREDYTPARELLRLLPAKHKPL